MSSNATSKVIRALIASCKDCEYDFKLFAQHTHEESLREQYWARAVRCHRTAQELQTHLADDDQKARLHGSAQGWLHRGWLRLRTGSRLTHHDDHWLSSCSATEIKLINQMRHAIKASVLPEPLQAQVTRYIHAWQHIHGQMRQLRKAAKPSCQPEAMHVEES